MIRLNKFYDLVSRNAHILLVNENGSCQLYCGSLHSIPDQYDNREVLDFTMSNDGTIAFRLKGVAG